MVHIGSLISLFVFFLVILVIGFWAAWKKTRKCAAVGDKQPRSPPHEVMIVANRDIGTVVGMFTMTAVWVGGGYILGTTESVFKQGLVWTQAPIGYSLSLIVGGLFFAGPMRSRNYVTMLDPFQQRYGAKLGAIMYLPAFVGEIFWSACVVASLGSTLAVIVELNFQTSVILSTLVAVLYTFLGGQYSVCYTDVAQLVMIVFGLVICTPFVWRNEFFQPKNLANLTQEAYGNSSYNDTAPNSTNRIDWLGHVTVQEWPRYFDEYALIILGGIPWQDYFQRVLAAKSVRNAQLLSIIGGFFCLLLAIPPIIMGYVAAYTDWDAVGYGYKNALKDSQLILPLVLQHLTPTFVALLGLGAIAGGVMSSTDASVLSTSSMFCHNVYHAVLRPRATNTELLWIVRLGFLCAGALACFLAILDRSIYNLWVFCSDFVFVVIFPQFFLVLYCPFIEKYGYLAGTSAGFLVRILGGEHSLGIPAAWKLPFYDFDQNRQIFPFKSFAALVNLMVSLAVSSTITLVGKTRQKYEVTKQRNVEMRTGDWIVTSKEAGQESNPNLR